MLAAIGIIAFLAFAAILWQVFDLTTDKPRVGARKHFQGARRG